MPILPYDIGWSIFQQVLTQFVRLILLWTIGCCLKGFYLFLTTGSSIFDKCCGGCHSILEWGTDFTINVLHTTILPWLSRSDCRILPRQWRHHYNKRGCIGYGNWCFCNKKNYSSGQHGRFCSSMNHKIHHKGQYPYLKLKKKPPPPAPKHHKQRQKWAKLMLVHQIDNDKHTNDVDNTKSPEPPPTPPPSQVKKQPPPS